MKKYAIIVLVTVLTTGFAVREFFPKTIREEKVVPRIVTHYDTVPVLPRWYEDSVRHWKRRKYTTDTVTIVIQQTTVDTQYIPVNEPPERRPNIWPLLRYSGGSEFGDTAFVTTFGLRDGKLTLSKVFIPGILIGIDAQDSLRTPRINFAPFPRCPGPSFLYKLKMMGIGGGIVGVTGAIF